MREIRSYGSVGEQGGNELLYPDNSLLAIPLPFSGYFKKNDIVN
jgi:hypothetical protein